MAFYTSFSDAELVTMLQKGEERAFNEIYARYWKKLYVIARHRLNNTCEAEEIVQDVFSNLWRKRESFHLDRSFSVYFSVAVKFEVINRLQKREKGFAFQRKFAERNTELDQSTLEQLDLNELQQQLEETIKSLPEKCQLIFRMQYEGRRSQRQIAEELKISEKTVEAHLGKARKTIRNRFGPLKCILFNLL